MPLDARQQRERDYHRERSAEHEAIAEQPVDWSVLDRPERRWWNAYWCMYEHLVGLDVAGKRVLVVGCGFGDDALRLAKMGAEVHAFDLSPESLSIARRLAEREDLTIHFDEMPAEQLNYPSSSFDLVLARDILHHVDIALSMAQLRRVAKPGALFVINEIYSHSWTDMIRRSALVERVLYPRMRRLIYGAGKPYITADERKLTERDLEDALTGLRVESRQHFNFIVTRLIPDRFDSASKLDRLLMMALPGRYLAGRVLIVARVQPTPSPDFL